MNGPAAPLGPSARKMLDAVKCALFALMSAAGLAAVGRAVPAAASPASPQPTISWTWSSVEASPKQPRGYVQFQRDCAVCHGSGPAKPGTRALRAKYHDKEPALLAERRDLAPEYIRSVVRHGVYVMPPFRKTELSDPDLAAIVAYLTRNNPAAR